MLKTRYTEIPDWKEEKTSARTNCKNQRNSFDFLFYKRQNARIFAQNLPENDQIHYITYSGKQFWMLKTLWKKWKTMWETGAFLHKNSGKPGGKSEKLLRRR